MTTRALVVSLVLMGCPSTPAPAPPPPPPVAAPPVATPPPVAPAPSTARTISSSELVRGCLADPPPVDPKNPDAYAAPPWDSCPKEIRSVRPLPVFDEQQTITARQTNPRACCYRYLGNR